MVAVCVGAMGSVGVEFVVITAFGVATVGVATIGNATVGVITDGIAAVGDVGAVVGSGTVLEQWVPSALELLACICRGWICRGRVWAMDSVGVGLVAMKKCVPLALKLSALKLSGLEMSGLEQLV